MAKTPKSPGQASLTQAAESQMPGWRVVEVVDTVAPDGETPRTDASPGRKVRADVVLPSLDRLQAKYLGSKGRTTRAEAGSDAAASKARDAGRDAVDDTALVTMANGPLRKTVAVSKSRRKVLWSQG